MTCAVEDVLHRCGLHDPTAIHHRDAVGESGDDAEVVADEDDAGMGLPLGDAQQIEDLGLDRHVQCRGRLIGDDEVGVVGDGHGDDDALTHTTGELVREGLGTHLGVGDAHHVEQFDGTIPGARLAESGVMHLQRLDELVTDRVHRRERRQRILEDHGDLGASHVGHPFVTAAEQLGTVQFDGSLDLGVVVEQPHDRHRGDGFSGAGLPHDAKDLTGMHREVDATHRVDDTVLGGEPYVEILNLQHGHSRGRCRQGTGLEGLVFFLAHA